jgi:hypothetical protein
MQPDTLDIGHPSNAAELTRRGLELYDTRLKPILEPGSNGQFVAIHVGSGDYYLGKTASAASRELRAHHPVNGQRVLRKVGSEPEYAVAARLFAPGAEAFHDMA